MDITKHVFWTKDTDYLVIVCYYDADITWVERLKLPHLIYYKEKPEKEPFSAINKGGGETNTLKFIYDFYDMLPKNIIQVHQYEYKSYNNGSLVDILNDPLLPFKYKTSIYPGYWSFNLAIMGSVEAQIEPMLKSGWWENCMQPYFGTIESCGDFTNGKKACSQFIVSRERIHSLPREFYLNMYNWIINNTIDEEKTNFDPVTLSRILTKDYRNPNSTWFTSRYMEWSWELIFTSWKPTDKSLLKLSDGRNIMVLYGAKSYYRDVTAKFVTLLISDNGKFKLPNCNLNDKLGDPLLYSVKTLRIIIDGKMTELDENCNIIL